MNNIIDNLNKEQLEAVTTIKGACQVNACAGSGKTRVLTKRIAYMIASGINPSKIMVATFTKKAAEEMKERLQDLITPNQLRALTIGTFHSIGYKILRHEYRLMKHPLAKMDLLMGEPQRWLMDKIIDDLKIKKFSDDMSSIILAEINNYKLRLIEPNALLMMAKLDENSTDYDVDVATCYVEYEKRKTAKGQIDFNDMIYQLYHMFVDHPEILKRYQDKFEYVLVDETQDCNPSQYTLIEMLAAPENNIFVVGDDDQSIYGFRGADPSNFINFKENYNAKVISLQKNYRSKPFILDAANKLIKHNTVRIKKKLVPFKNYNSNEKIGYHSFQNEDKEAEYIANQITNLNKQGSDFKDMFVIYRTNAQARAIEDACIKKGIPYFVQGSISFYDRAEVKDMLAYLRLAFDCNDDEALLRVINKPSRFLGNIFINNLKAAAKAHHTSLFRALNYVHDTQFKMNQANDFKNIIYKLGVEIQNKDKTNLIQTILKITKYDEYLKKDGQDEEDNIRMENIKSLQGVIDAHSSIRDLIVYINNIKQINDENADTVKLMTIHKSKGLESKIVFMVGLNEGILPHQKAIEEDRIEEERRLAYVGITRAKDKLYMTCSGMFQKSAYFKSRFLGELELEK